jgi:hypothetical protein
MKSASELQRVDPRALIRQLVLEYVISAVALASFVAVLYGEPLTRIVTTTGAPPPVTVAVVVAVAERKYVLQTPV